jgi:glycosyltransferase involved in cell wall biosynthesis
MIVNSEAMRRQLLEETPWLRIPVDVIHNGVDTDRFRPVQDTAALRDELGLPRAAFVIGYAGVFQPRKRVDMLVRAAAAVPANTARHLLLIGDGHERPELEALAARLDLPATFVGRRDDVGRLLPAADVIAHLSAAEGFANSVLEALACGVPVIATDEHSHPEQIDDGVTGVLVQPDAAAVADALTRLAGDTNARLAMGRAARDSALARFAVERMVDHYVTVLARVAEA